LTKVGAGTAILAAANTYGGGTTISAGTLEVSGSVAGNVTVSSTSGTALRLDNHTALASGATLTLPNSPAAGAVNLNFSSGQQSIAGLTIGTTSMAQGTWGSTSSSAAHTSTAFSGNGLLNVTSGGATPSIAMTSITPNPVCSGSTVSLTATVSGGNSPSGTVQFFGQSPGEHVRQYHGPVLRGQLQQFRHLYRRQPVAGGQRAADDLGD
jgi:fibronectin-binding autotransporter adhesin